MRLSRALAALAFLAAVGGGPLAAQEKPLTAGAEGVPVPKKTKHVQPVYPPEALAQGIRGIVILDLVIDASGHVAATTVVRSVPGLDEAAITAARQWEYEPVKVNAQPVRVSLTVPITFALTLPKLQREAGIPELRQGISPPLPAGGGRGRASAEVTLEADGRIGGARILEGDEPWAGALLAALKTWRFAPPPEDATLSFRVEAEFASEKGAPVALKAVGPQRTDLLASAAPGPADPGPATPTPATPTSAPPSTAPSAPAAPAAAPAAPAAAPIPPASAAPVTPATVPANAPPAQTSPVPSPKAPAERTPTPTEARPAASGPTGTTPSKPVATAVPPDRTAPPPIEVITAPPPPPVAENGVSAVRDVTLALGVPDLATGRRPVMPPLARMGGTSGKVEVAFSVSAGGSTTVQTATGPEVLTRAAEQTVASWSFRRARADRAYLVAVFTYGDDKASAVVSPQPPPSATPAGSPTPPAGTAPAPTTGSAPTNPGP